uniref:Uncharacterized protein n=1 Tax=Hemiselmis andersenii TaxID=464988 RepID=A0A6T8IJM9_HEMAN
MAQGKLRRRKSKLLSKDPPPHILQRAEQRIFAASSCAEEDSKLWLLLHTLCKCRAKEIFRIVQDHRCVRVELATRVVHRRRFSSESLNQSGITPPAEEGGYRSGG